MRFVICAFAMIAMFGCEKRLEELDVGSVQAETVQTVPSSVVNAAENGTVVPVVAPTTESPPVQPPVVQQAQPSAGSTLCPPSCFSSGTMNDTGSPGSTVVSPTR